MSYRTRIEDYVNDLNMLISDTMLMPDYVDRLGKYVLSFDKTETEFICQLNFIEGEEELTIFRKSSYDIDLTGIEHFYKICYYNIFRNVMLSMDIVGRLNDPVSKKPINVLSFDTIAREGLKKIREWKLNKY